TWDGGGTGGTNMDTAANWSADTVPSGSAGDTAQWDGTVLNGPLSLTYTATGTGANLAASSGFVINVLGSFTSSLTINETSGTGAAVVTRDFGTGSAFSSIGQNGTDVGTLTMQGNGTITSAGDFNVGDVGSSQGTLNIQDSATLTINNGANFGFFVGSANGSG